MRTSRSHRPGAEPLEQRGLLNAAMAAPHPLVAHVARPAHHQHVNLAGAITGAFSASPAIPDVGRSQELSQAAGIVRPLGTITAEGTLHSPGFIARGQTTGTVTLTNAQGTLTVSLTGSAQPGFSGPPPTFNYTIGAGSGAYAHASGRGTASFQEIAPAVDSPSGTAEGTSTGAGTFVLTFRPGR